MLSIINITDTANPIVKGNGTILAPDDWTIVPSVLFGLLEDKTQIFELFVYPTGQAVKHNVALKLMNPEEQLVTQYV